MNFCHLKVRRDLNSSYLRLLEREDPSLPRDDKFRFFYFRDSFRFFCFTNK